MNSSLLYEKNFGKSIEDEVYEFNLYDTFVSNNIIKGSQITVCSHIDNLKLIKNIPKVVSKTITWIKQ